MFNTYVDEVNKARIEARELTIRFHELPEKEAQFKRIDAKNDQLRGLIVTFLCHPIMIIFVYLARL